MFTFINVLAVLAALVSLGIGAFILFNKRRRRLARIVMRGDVPLAVAGAAVFTPDPETVAAAERAYVRARIARAQKWAHEFLWRLHPLMRHGGFASPEPNPGNRLHYIHRGHRHAKRQKINRAWVRAHTVVGKTVENIGSQPVFVS